MTIIIIAAIIAVIAVAVIMKKKGSPQEKQDNMKAAQPEPASSDPDKEYASILETLLKLNIMIRKDIELPVQMVEKTEAVIDDLVAVIPQMMERYPGETLTYELKKTGSTHLFKTVKEYLDLSEQSRKAQYEIFGQTIGSLHEICRRARNIVEKNETAEFKTMANFLAGKFS